MYMPYLHGKQEELFALLDLGSTLTQVVVPIVKPVNLSPPNQRRLARIAANSRFALITNSDKGRPGQRPTYASVAAALAAAPLSNAARVFPAFEIRGDSSLAELTTFAADHSARRCVLVHKGHAFGPGDLAGPLSALSMDPVHVFVEPGVAAGAFTSLPAVARVVIRDGFAARERNADYPPQSAFDDLVRQYAARGFDGLGDFCMIGDRYSAGGGKARAVALHITEDTGVALKMNHFVSTTPDVDVPTMYAQARDALAANIGSPPRVGLDTEGVRAYIRDPVFHGLGRAKRWSAMHHIELVQSILQTAGATPKF